VIPSPTLTDEQAAIITRWAEDQSDKLRAVLLYGSRFTGHRRPKDNPSPVPDVDLAVSLSGRDDQDRLNVFLINRRRWSDQLSSLLGLPVEIMSADPDIGPLVTSFLITGNYKVLWCDPSRWSAEMIQG
jgi:hypothetical protein